ncbi:hypothetical protein JCM19238_2645 [Vibrio ponticus]|nr:hypothetical protein JCM19238_2645 [Vibrio ponticus]
MSSLAGEDQLANVKAINQGQGLTSLFETQTSDFDKITAPFTLFD